MKHRRITMRRGVLAGAGVAGLATAAILLPGANAAPSPTPDPKALTSTAAVKLASQLGSELGADAVGSYYDDKADRLVVNVVDETAAELVRRAGAVPKTVEHSTAELRSATTTLSERAGIPGTAWAVDPVTNQVVVTADRTVTSAELDTLSKTVAGLDGTARIEKSAGEFKPFIAGGDAIYSGGSRCSLGFNVVKDGVPHFLTAGHCGPVGTSWSGSAGGGRIGVTEKSSFPGNDYALVKYTANVAHPSAVNLYNGSSQSITGAAEATVGMAVQRSGSTTQLHGGRVTGLNATVNYQEGSVSGLIKTDVCAEPGDSGGSLFSGNRAVGLTSGGSGNCSTGGQTFFQPVTEALQVFGARIG